MSTLGENVKALIDKELSDRDAAAADQARTIVTQNAQITAQAATITTMQQQIDALKAGQTPTPVPPSNAQGFIGRTITNDGKWKTVFEDDFLTVAPEGEFLNKYKTWNAYTEKYFVTNASPYRKPTPGNGNHYATSNISARNGAMNLRLIPGGKTPDGKAWGCAPYPMLQGQDRASVTTLRGEVRARCLDPHNLWKLAWMLWPDSENWPRDGEIDVVEGILTGEMNANMHRQWGVNGADQDQFRYGVRFTPWHVFGFEWRPNYFSCWVDGKRAKTSIGTTEVLSRVPNTPMHFVLQTEPEIGAQPTAESNVEIDWLTLQVAA